MSHKTQQANSVYQKIDLHLNEISYFYENGFESRQIVRFYYDNFHMASIFNHMIHIFECVVLKNNAIESFSLTINYELSRFQSTFSFNEGVRILVQNFACFRSVLLFFLFSMKFYQEQPLTVHRLFLHQTVLSPSS